MDISIVVCTYNRAESLRETLTALRRLSTPSKLKHEIIVVDNNSSDHTRQVVENFMTEAPFFKYEFESQQGLSHARNHGIRSSSGEVIFFTDDDVLPEKNWLIETLHGMEKHHADACGGFIAPIFEKPAPHWLTPRFYGFLAVRNDRSDDYAIENPSQAPFGANMAFKRIVFERVGGFDTGRGRKGSVLASGEDGEMFERILAANLRAVFLGKSRVHHKVEAHRLTKHYFRRWRIQTSRNIAISRGIPGERRVINIPLYLIPQLFRAVLWALIAKFNKPADEAFNREIVVCHFIGTLQGLWQTRKSKISS